MVSSISRCGRPDVGHVDGLAVAAFADGVFAQVDVDAAGQREGDHQRRGHQVVGADFGIDAAFEIAIAGEHGRDDQFFFVDGLRHFFGQWAGVADARGAAVADQMKFQLLEIGSQAGLGEIVSYGFRSGGERGLDPGRDGQAFLDGFFREQAGGDQDGWIGRVGAGSNGGDDDAAVFERIFH